MSVEAEKLPPAMWGHTLRVFEAMHENASVEKHQIGGNKESTDVLVWEGYTTKLTGELGIPVPYYGQILDSLQRLGSIQQVRRGGGNAQSRWMVFGPPELKDWLLVQEEIKPRPRANRQSTLEQKVADIEERLQGLDVVKAIAELQSQIDQLKGVA